MNNDGYSGVLGLRMKIKQEEMERQNRLEREYDFQVLKRDNDYLKRRVAALESQVIGLGLMPVLVD